MTNKLVILVCLVAVIVEFFSLLWGWVILFFPAVFLLLTLFTVKRKKWQYIPELSDAANKLLQKYGHYYAMPFAGIDFSASAVTIIRAGIIVAIIGIFKGFWWGIVICIIYWICMGFFSKAFNPTSFLHDPSEKMAHEEIFNWIDERR